MTAKILLVLLVLGVLIVGVILLVPWGERRPEKERPLELSPRILKIEFPQQIVADGQKVLGTVHFHDPDGDIIEVRFEVVKARIFDPFAFDPKVQGQKEGHFSFFVFTYFPQEITLRVILIDAQGHTSTPMEFSFEAVFPQEGGQGAQK